MDSPVFPASPSPRALVLAGALPGGREVDAIADCVADELERLGLRAQRVTLREVRVAPCLGCFECWTRTPGVCTTNDAGRDLARAWVRSTVVALVTPVTFGGYSSELKKAIDRLLCLALPFFTRIRGEVHHPFRYARAPALLAVGVLPEPDAARERIFHELARRNAVNLHAPAVGSHVLVGRRAAEDVADADLRGAIAGVLDRSWSRPGAAAAHGGVQ